jgi:hypothetical protein
VYLEVHGELRCFIPVMCVIVQDSKDGNTLTNVLSSPRTPFPCRFCWCPCGHLNNPHIWCSRRQQAGIALKVRRWARRIARKKRGEIGPARATAQSMSLQPYDSPLFDLPWGASSAGVFQGCPAEPLHQYLLGTLKDAKDYCLLDMKTVKRSIE